MHALSVLVYRHEIAEAAGLISQAFGTEEVNRHIVLFKKVCVCPCNW